jgi:hypothetical protein
MGAVALAVGLFVIACLAFVAAIQLGMLVGLRIDRLVETKRDGEAAPNPGDGGAEATQPRNQEGPLGE